MTGTWRVAAAVLGPSLPALCAAGGVLAVDASRLPGGNLPGAPALPQETREALAGELERRGADYVPRTRHRTPTGGPVYTNRLLLEASPYLQQHAHNPVSWHAWGDEAFAAAKRLGRPILVSIGYSTCHWCHVMEDESFDDVETARLLNERFVAIKVDREARPDVDAVYMAAARSLSGQGGWPLNVWLTADGEPFFAGTYFPPGDVGGDPRARGGRPGFRQVLRSIDERWNEPGGRARLEGAAARVSAAVRRDLESLEADQSRAPDAGPLHAARDSLGARFDPEWGGLRGRTKFPASLPVRFLLRYHRRTGDPDALAMAVFSLERMAAGGMYDQIGGGFHRYATDPGWRVPHFEKMLYDQALLTLAYVESWQATGRNDFARVARGTLDYVAREMTAPGGAFTSASDADSPAPGGERVEGYYFTWTPEEVETAVGSQAAPIVSAWYGVTRDGHLHGRSVLHVGRTPERVADELGTTPEAVRRTVEAARPRLLAARAERPAPLRDEKIVTAWNGLMISAFARAGFALDDAEYRARAARAATFVLDRMWKEGRLARVALGEATAGPAFLEDHAFLVAGLLDLYEADGDAHWLRSAVEIQAAQDRDYLDATSGVYLRAPRDARGLLAHERPARDGAVPSGNAVAAMNLLRLHELTLDPTYLERARTLRSAHGTLLAREPASVAELLLALERELDTPREIVIVRPTPAADVGPMLEPLRRAHLPSRALVVTTADRPELADADAASVAVPWAAGRTAREGRVTAYVCENQVCDLPTTDPGVLAQQIRPARPLPGATR